MKNAPSGSKLRYIVISIILGLTLWVSASLLFIPSMTDNAVCFNGAISTRADNPTKQYGFPFTFKERPLDSCLSTENPSPDLKTNNLITDIIIWVGTTVLVAFAVAKVRWRNFAPIVLVTATVCALSLLLILEPYAPDYTVPVAAILLCLGIVSIAISFKNTERRRRLGRIARISGIVNSAFCLALIVLSFASYGVSSEMGDLFLETAIAIVVSFVFAHAIASLLTWRSSD